VDIAAEFEKFKGTVGNAVTSIADEFEAFRSGGKQQPAAPLVQPAVEAPKKPDYIERLKYAESGGDVAAKAKTSSAVGHHQFVKKTWGELSTKYNLGYGLEDRLDPEKSRKVAELYTDENRKILTKALKAEPTDTQLYAAHFLGPTGAKKLLLAPPMAPAIKHVDAAQVKANKNIFYDKQTGKPRKVIEVYALLQKKIGE
jgi:hypothetical protein